MPKTIFNKMDETQWQRFLSSALIFFKDFEPGQLKKLPASPLSYAFIKKCSPPIPRLWAICLSFPLGGCHPFLYPLGLVLSIKEVNLKKPLPQNVAFAKTAPLVTAQIEKKN
jgi:hypothetical protein